MLLCGLRWLTHINMTDKEIALEILKIAASKTNSLNELEKNAKAVSDVFEKIKSGIN